MEDKVFPNFVQGLILTICLMIIFAVSLFIETLPIRFHAYLPGYYIPLVTAISSALCIPVVYYALKKSKIDILKDLYFPNFKFIILIVLFAVSIKIISQPITHPIRFFRSFSNDIIEYLNFRSLRIDTAFSIRLFHSLILGPVIEEVFFRRILLGQFLKKYNPIIAVSLSAILFSIYHIEPNDIWFLFLYGLVFGYFYYKTNSLVASILLHSLTNLLTWTTKINTTSLDDDSLMNMFLVFSACIIVLYVFEKYSDRFIDRESSVIKKYDSDI